MDRRYLFRIAAIIVTAVVMVPTSGIGQQAAEHKLLTPKDIKWAPAPPAFPPGAQVAVLYGDPTKEGLFVLQMKVPKGYHIPPHTHPKPEIFTVLSGTTRVGMGTTADRAAARPLPAGSFVLLSPDTAHYVFADEDTVIQINTMGPWGISYVNAKDDPRQKAK